MHMIILRILSVWFILCTIVCAPATWSADVLTLLHWDTWSFSAEEIKTLNAIDRKVLETEIASIIKDVTGYKEEDPLMDFKVIDLNGDGIAEVIVRTDVSGRWLSRDVCVLSRNNGKYHYEIVPSYGIKITLWETKDQKFIVGSEPVFELVRCDPLLAFPEVYAWTGSKCENVSKQHWLYYRDQLLPLITNEISEFKNTNFRSLEPEPKHRLAVSALNWALAAEKLGLMFPEVHVLRDLMKREDNLLSALRLDDNEHPELVKEFRDVRERIRLKIGVRP